MIKHSLSFWQLITLVVAVALIVPLPASWIGPGNTSALRIAAYHGEEYIEAAQRWAGRAERNLQTALYPPARSMDHAWASLVDEWSETGQRAGARLGAIGLRSADLWSLLPLDRAEQSAAG